MKNLNKTKGITLIALVITIIILLILAGLTINSLIGNGLFKKTELAKEKTDTSQKEENETLKEYEDILNEHINGSRDEVSKQEYEDLKNKVGQLETDIINYKNKFDEHINLDWKYLGTATGQGNGIKLPDEYSEIYVKAYYDDFYYTPTSIPKISLTDNEIMRIGYGNGVAGNGRYQFFELIYKSDINSLVIGTCYSESALVPGKVIAYYR